MRTNSNGSVHMLCLPHIVYVNPVFYSQLFPKQNNKDIKINITYYTKVYEDIISLKPINSMI